MTWNMLDGHYRVKALSGGQWVSAKATAVDPGTGSIQASYPERVLGTALGEHEILTLGPDEWVAEGTPIPGMPVIDNRTQ